MTNEVVHVAFCTDQNNIRYMAVALESVVSSSSDEVQYVVHILHDGMTCEEVCLTKSIVLGYENFELNFIDVRECVRIFDSVFIDRHLTRATYWRFVLPSILSKVDKVLYLDTDVLVLEDVKKLYETDISGYFVAGCSDIAIRNLYVLNQKNNSSLLEFGYKDFDRYINGGVLLFNLSMLREGRICDKLIEFSSKHNLFYHDQDAINYILRDKIKLLDGRWNFIANDPDVWGGEIEEALEEQISSFNLGIVHYTGIKPWNSCPRYLGGLWLMHAVRTPFFAGLNLRPFSKEECEVNKFIAKRNRRKVTKWLETKLIPDFLHKWKRVIKAKCSSTK